MLSFTHEQHIICSQTQMDDLAHEQTIICRQLFAGHLVGSLPMKRTKNLHPMIKKYRAGKRRSGDKKSTFKVVALEYFFIIGLLLDR